MVSLYFMETMKNVKKIIKYSLFLLIILMFVNTYLCSKIQEVDVELLESEIVNISNKSNFDLELFETKEEQRQNFSGIFQQRVNHVNKICKYFNQDLTRLG